MINFHKQSPVYVQIDGETVFKQYVEGSCNTADLSNLPTDVAGGSVVTVVDPAEGASRRKIFDADTEAWVDYPFEQSGGGGKFIVTLTPTALDYSGTMDKTVAEINAAYEAGQEIVFRVVESATEFDDVKCTVVFTNTGYQYPSFNGYILNGTNNVFVFAYTGITNDGTSLAYYTTVYSLTPAS